MGGLPSSRPQGGPGAGPPPDLHRAPGHLSASPGRHSVMIGTPTSAPGWGGRRTISDGGIGAAGFIGPNLRLRHLTTPRHRLGRSPLEHPTLTDRNGLQQRKDRGFATSWSRRGAETSIPTVPGSHQRAPGRAVDSTSSQRPLLTYSPGSSRGHFRPKMFASKNVVPQGSFLCGKRP